MIKAIQTRILVELKGLYDNISTTEEKFGTSKMRGVVLDIAEDVKDECAKPENDVRIGSTVFFGKYEDTGKFPYELNGKEVELALIKLEEIGGVENE
jgi:co-chaperonin GroES (HSP10)